MAYGGLKAYVKKPLLTFVKILMKVPKYKKSFPEKLPDDIKKQVAIITSMYLIMNKKTSNEKAFSIVQAIITPIALSVQFGNFRFAQNERNFENLKKSHQRSISEGPTRTNKLEIIEETDKIYHFRVKSCLHQGLFKRLGVPELTRIMCNVDNALYNLYSPDKVVFHRNGYGNTIVDGCKYCEFICENKINI